MNKEEFMKKTEREADHMFCNGKGWFSAKVVFEILEQAKTVKEVKDKLEFLRYEPRK